MRAPRLQESAATMTNILENTADGFFAVDADWKFTYVNPEAEILLGQRRDELYGSESCGRNCPN